MKVHDFEDKELGREGVIGEACVEEVSRDCVTERLASDEASEFERATAICVRSAPAMPERSRTRRTRCHPPTAGQTASPTPHRHCPRRDRRPVPGIAGNFPGPVIEHGAHLISALTGLAQHSLADDEIHRRLRRDYEFAPGSGRAASADLSNSLSACWPVPTRSKRPSKSSAKRSAMFCISRTRLGSLSEELLGSREHNRVNGSSSRPKKGGERAE